MAARDESQQEQLEYFAVVPGTISTIHSRFKETSALAMSPSNGKKTPSKSNEKEPRSTRQIIPEAKHLEICKRFKQMNKHTNMPQHYEYKGMKTGKFLANKRQLYKDKDPSNFKPRYWMVEFKTIGFPWKVATTDNKSSERDVGASENGETASVNERNDGKNEMATDEFMKQFFELTAFKNTHRHLYVPPDDELASFCDLVRASKATGILLADQRAMLEALEFPWNTFQEGFVLLSKFKNVHGHCNVPRNNEIYSFCQEMRRQMKAKALDANHRTALDCINFDWDDKHTRRPQPKLPTRVAKSRATCSSNDRRSRNSVERLDESESSEEESLYNQPNMQKKSRATCSSNDRRSRNSVERLDESESSEEEESLYNQPNTQKASEKPPSSSSVQIPGLKLPTRARRSSRQSKDATERLDDESFKCDSSEEEGSGVYHRDSNSDDDISSGDDDDKQADEGHNKDGNKDNAKGSNKDKDEGGIEGSIEDENEGGIEGGNKDEGGIEDEDEDETNDSSPALIVCIEKTTSFSMDKYDGAGCDNLSLKPSKRQNSEGDTGSESDVSSEEMNAGVTNILVSVG